MHLFCCVLRLNRIVRCCLYKSVLLHIVQIVMIPGRYLSRCRRSCEFVQVAIQQALSLDCFLGIRQISWNGGQCLLLELLHYGLVLGFPNTDSGQLPRHRRCNALNDNSESVCSCLCDLSYCWHNVFFEIFTLVWESNYFFINQCLGIQPYNLYIVFTDFAEF